MFRRIKKNFSDFCERIKENIVPSVNLIKQECKEQIKEKKEVLFFLKKIHKFSLILGMLSIFLQFWKFPFPHVGIPMGLSVFIVVYFLHKQEKENRHYQDILISPICTYLGYTFSLGVFSFIQTIYIMFQCC
ncbi:hypothetical protein [Fusobacterium necrophorum]|uniref:hypothetical protein n=1 Tax=Fusobacterium necrophorum TaxID=859 RepID=UPI00370E2938